MIDEKAVFSAAREIAEAAPRERYLEEACRGEPEALRRIQELLKIDERAQSFLESPAVARFESRDAAPPLESPGSVIGQYRLLEQIGEGGCGVVFMAEQTHPVRRRVALKVIKPGMDTRHVIARFEAERQALALMDHPNIARIFDAGTTATGRPYFVMELVRGVPITEYCDAHRLSPRERLELFVTVCHSVQHAHQKGIIHRDLKPTNVLVTQHDDRPVVKVIDFGIAKATNGVLTDRTLFTGFAQLVGTPLYMSPEQASMNALDVDTRSDIYSLGVLLYEVLAGAPPFDRARLQEAAFDEIRRIIREEEPATPSTRLSTSDALPTLAANRGMEPAKLTRLVRGELDWIVMKALEKDRQRRYETANGFAMDVQRYLADEPVLACPPSALYRARKFVRRNRGGVVAAALVLAALAAGVVGTSLGLVRAADRAEGERRAKERAQEDFALANEAVEKYLGTVAEDPGLRRAEFFALRNRLMGSAIPFFERIARRRSEDPALEYRRGQAHLRLAGLHTRMGDPGASAADARAAVEVYSRLTNGHPDETAYLRELAGSYAALGLALRTLGNYAEAERAYRPAVEIFERLAGEATEPPRFDDNLAGVHHSLGMLLHDMGDTRGAEAAFRRTLEVYSRLPDPVRRRRAMANPFGSLGSLLQALGRFPEATTALRENVNVLKEICDEQPGNLEAHAALVVARLNLGGCLEDQARYEEAETEHREAVGVSRKLIAEFGNVPGLRNRLAGSLASLGSCIQRQGMTRGADARAASLEAVGLWRGLVADCRSVPEYRARLARGLLDLGTLHIRMGKTEEAREARREALVHFEALVAEFPGATDYASELGGGYTLLGQDYRASGDPTTALDWFGKALELLEPLVRVDRPTTSARQALLTTLHGKAGALEALDRRPEALPLRERALVVARELRGATDPDTRVHMRLLVDSLLQLNRGAEAVPLIDEYVRGAADQPAQARHVSRLIGARIRHFQRRGDASGCRETVEMWERLNRTDAGSLYDAACYWAVTSAVLRAAEGNPAGASEADRAMDWLGKALAAGFDDLAYLEKDPDLDALRDREDFRSLVSSRKGSD